MLIVRTPYFGVGYNRDQEISIEQNLNLKSSIVKTQSWNTVTVDEVYFVTLITIIHYAYVNIIGKTRFLHSICSPQHMPVVVHSIHPQDIEGHMLWVYVVDEFIYCGCMLWATKQKRQMCSTTYHILWRTSICCGQHVWICAPQHRWLLSTTCTHSITSL